MRLGLTIVIALLILGRLAYVEAILWYAGRTSCDCHHDAGCPFADEELN